MFVQPMTYAYNTRAHRSTKLSPLSPFLSYQPPVPISFDNHMALQTDVAAATSLQALKATLLQRVAKMRQEDNKWMKA